MHMHKIRIKYIAFHGDGRYVFTIGYCTYACMSLSECFSTIAHHFEYKRKQFWGGYAPLVGVKNA